MKILNLKVENICGNEGGEIFADGANVLLSRQNCTKKTPTKFFC